jgi:hypothetical protein
MIKNLFLFASVVSTMALADDLPEPGLATPAYTPPAYIPAPAYTQQAYPSPPPAYTQQAYPSPPTYATYITIQTAPVTYAQPASYSQYPMVTSQLGYFNYPGSRLRVRR